MATVSYTVRDKRAGSAPKECTCGREPRVLFLSTEDTHAVVCEACNSCVSRELSAAEAVRAWNCLQEHGAPLQ